MQDKDSWFSLNLEPTLEDRPAMFGPKEISPFTKDTLEESRNAGMYSKGQISDFWDNILVNAASRNALQKFSRELIIPSNAHKGSDEFHYYAEIPETSCFPFLVIGNKVSNLSLALGVIPLTLKPCANSTIVTSVSSTPCVILH